MRTATGLVGAVGRWGAAARLGAERFAAARFLGGERLGAAPRLAAALRGATLTARGGDAGRAARLARPAVRRFGAKREGDAFVRVRVPVRFSEPAEDLLAALLADFGAERFRAMEDTTPGWACSP
ncbi:MAG: hypothetical protein ACYDBQ_12755 [Thermoplasmatota archaeon]